VACGKRKKQEKCSEKGVLKIFLDLEISLKIYFGKIFLYYKFCVPENIFRETYFQVENTF